MQIFLDNSPKLGRVVSVLTYETGGCDLDSASGCCLTLGQAGNWLPDRKKHQRLSDRNTMGIIRENPYMQYLLGCSKYQYVECKLKRNAIHSSERSVMSGHTAG